MTSERRLHARACSAYALRLRRPGDQAGIETSTVNISSGGFYCISPLPFSPGELLECELVIPATAPNRDSDLTAQRRVLVVRLEVRGLEEGFGLACRFEQLIQVSLSGGLSD